jgi:replicative DNA helicase
MTTMETHTKDETIKFLEETILCTLISYPETYYNMVSYGLKDHHFNNGYTKLIFSKIGELINQEDEDSIDFATIYQLVMNNKLASETISKLATQDPTQNWKPFVDKLFDQYYINQLGREYNLFLDSVMTEKEEVKDALYKFQSRIALMSINKGQECFDMGTGVQSLKEDFNKRNENHRNGKSNFVLSGFRDLDAIIDGFEECNLTILAGRPATGKTAFLLSTILNMISTTEPTPCLLFSFEMSALSLLYRIAAMMSGVPSQSLKKGFVPEPLREDFSIALDRLKTLPLYIYDTPCKVEEISAISTEYMRKFGVKIVGVDYLQLVIPTDAKIPREQQVANISRQLKVLANKTNLSIIVLAQLSRGVEIQQREPRPSDLRESGSLEQDADKIIMLSPVCEQGKEMASRSGLVDVLVPKNREGKTSRATLFFNRSITLYENYEEENSTQPQPTIVKTKSPTNNQQSLL